MLCSLDVDNHSAVSKEQMVREFDESIVIGKYLEAVNTISGDVNE